MIGAILGLSLTLMLAACGETATIIPSTGSNATTIIAPGNAAKTLLQPQVIRTAKDDMRSSINFTEQPTLNDGVPTLLWFDAVG